MKYPGLLRACDQRSVHSARRMLMDSIMDRVRSFQTFEFSHRLATSITNGSRSRSRAIQAALGLTVISLKSRCHVQVDLQVSGLALFSPTWPSSNE